MRAYLVIMRIRSTGLFKTIILLIAVSSGSASRGTTLVTNLDESMAEQITLTSNWEFTQTFSTGDTGATLQELTFKGGGGFLTNHVEYLIVKLYQANGTNIGVFTNSANVAGNQYAFSGNFSLNANSTYSIGLTIDPLADVFGAGYLDYTSSLNQSGLAGWGIGDSFATWQSGQATAPTYTPGALSMSLSGAIPEPSAFSLLALSLGGLALLRRRQQG